MSIDATPLGQLTAVVMDDLDRAVDRGEMTDAQIVSTLVVVEVRHSGDEEDGRYSTVSARATDDSMTVGLGLAHRAIHTMLNPDGDLGE